MKSLNNKGMTAVELLVTFTILSVVVVGLLDMVLNYKDKEQQKSIKSSIIDYENKLQKTIQDDFIKGHLTTVNLEDTESDNELKATFQMDNPKYRKKDIDDYTDTLDMYSTTLTINFDTGVVSYGLTGKEINYVPPKFGTGDNKVTINKEKTIINIYQTDNSFVDIKIAFNYSDIDNDEILFSMTNPIDYPLELNNNDILIGTFTLNDSESFEVVDEDSYDYLVSDDEEYVKVEIENTSDTNLYYAFYYYNDGIDSSNPNIKLGYFTNDFTSLFNKGVFITAGDSKIFYLKLVGLKDKTIKLGVTVSTIQFTDLKVGTSIFNRITSLAETIKFNATLSDALNKSDPNKVFLSGLSVNNYIWYSGHLWRAVSIDNDTNALKIVTQTPETFISYGNIDFNGTPASNANIKKWLKKFYKALRNADNNVLPYSYDYNYYSDSGTLEQNQEHIVEKKISLLNVYEYLMTKKDDASYLNISSDWYTITPKADDPKPLYAVSKSRGLINVSLSNTSIGVRPVIVLNGTVEVNGGNGTSSSPYTISKDKAQGVENLVSGEYIQFPDDLSTKYMVVSHPNDTTTKIVAVGTSSRPFAYTNTDTAESKLRTYLNQNYYNSLSLNLRHSIVSSNWNTTRMSSTSSIDASSRSFNGNIGLLTVGELLSGRCSKKCCLLLTPTGSGEVYSVQTSLGKRTMVPVSREYSSCYVRPSMVLKNSYLKILRGVGVSDYPYVLSSY